MRRALPFAVLAVLIGCAPAPATPRFANAPVATKVDDRRDVATKPDEISVFPDLDALDSAAVRLLTRPLELPRSHRALGVNAFDEVPDSTWFTNRRGLTPAQMRTGSVTMDNPERHTPWTIKSTKPGGTSLGYIVKDARGIKYLVKFDRLGFPELETGTDVIVDRLLWAAGYNTPENYIAYVGPDELVLGPDAVVLDEMGNPAHKFKRKRLMHDLTTVEHERDGRIRCLVSRWLDGKPLGPPPSEGVRPDDPNDRIPHELRRDLRGMYTIYAWLDMVDVTTGNLIDMWVPDGSDSSRHYVMHYALDFGMSLGAMGAVGYDRRRGETYRFDWAQAGSSLITAGWSDRSWQDRPLTHLRGVGSLFSVATFDPGTWHADLPYVPFQVSDRFDQYWGAKIVTQFTRAQIQAAVEAARFSDPRSTEYVTDTLIARQHAIAAYWFTRVAPIDHVEIDPVDGLCFDDLGIQFDVADASATHYMIASTDQRKRPFGSRLAYLATPQGRACMPLPPLAPAADGYTIFAISIERPQVHGTTYVHVARDPSSHQPRVIGIWRE